jgi:phosphoribosyl-AMP cyclohydrolase
MIELNFKKMGGLIPAIAQDEKTGEVLMLAFMNRAAWEATLKTRRATYYSRTRDTLVGEGPHLRPHTACQGNPGGL